MGKKKDINKNVCSSNNSDYSMVQHSLIKDTDNAIFDF